MLDWWLYYWNNRQQSGSRICFLMSEGLLYAWMSSDPPEHCHWPIWDRPVLLISLIFCILFSSWDTVGTPWLIREGIYRSFSGWTESVKNLLPALLDRMSCVELCSKSVLAWDKPWVLTRDMKVQGGNGTPATSKPWICFGLSHL